MAEDLTFISWMSTGSGATIIQAERYNTPWRTCAPFAANCYFTAGLISSATYQIQAAGEWEAFMPTMTFEQQLHNDINKLRSDSVSRAEIRITRWGEPADPWVSWEVDLIVPPHTMDADAEQLYTDLGVLLGRNPYRILEEDIATDRIGYTVGSEGAAY